MNDEQIEELITQTINGAVSTIPAYLEDIKQNQESLKVGNPQEFVYGMIMGMALGMSGAILSAQEEMPTAEDQMKVRDIIYKYIPEIREQIFS
ncbi:hypothetical protein [Candidatus Nitrosarchaeum limnium]|jgi:hypothetical protein|uniref:Uncharacterized protein n=2 Tax=Candidatus Nitrosarchaeum limnium TaxID=1007084 RepID=S2E4L6_9ARCH|nr:hypothetical protein [Candidatus Nitrosarchaeum limnium]EGG42446.1 hypothetical protein Nlim_0627 [Candidatus Nitrosarchaeum limnium SFB1]EPA05698.1 hypothetical protein BG20_I1877 [Candidatus Nitrosarchaeum limnium BG20]